MNFQTEKLEFKSSLSQRKPKREWLLMQAQMQLDYGKVKNAEALLELLEAIYSESISSGLMLCKAWALLQEKDKLEKKAKMLLTNPAISCSQCAAIYFCLSTVRWKANECEAARQAYVLYRSYVMEMKSFE